MDDNKLPAYLTEGDGYVDIQLTREREFSSGLKSAVIRMRETTAGDMETFHNAKGSEATREMQTFANLCDLTPEDVRKLPLRDYKRLQEAFAVFTS